LREKVESAIDLRCMCSKIWPSGVVAIRPVDGPRSPTDLFNPPPNPSDFSESPLHIRTTFVQSRSVSPSRDRPTHAMRTRQLCDVQSSQKALPLSPLPASELHSLLSPPPKATKAAPTEGGDFKLTQYPSRPRPHAGLSWSALDQKLQTFLLRLPGRDGTLLPRSQFRSAVENMPIHGVSLASAASASAQPCQKRHVRAI
jgi:hypothetical protein